MNYFGIVIPEAHSHGEAEVQVNLFAGCAILLIFLLNENQVNHRQLESSAALEASYINSLDCLLLRFGHPQAIALREDAFLYIQSIVEDEWPNLHKGIQSDKTHMLWRSLSRKLIALDPENSRQSLLYQDILTKGDQLPTARESRLQASAVGLPDVFFYAIMVCITLLLIRNGAVIQTSGVTILEALLPIMLGALLALLVITDRPFKGEYCVHPTAFRNAIKSIKTRTS
ncbi:Protein of unknown function [Polynucleobacter meluiroseus]|uniref:Uncharacterized protein n=2 Tax=Polynucleobacter meluiroseus TaxID=1938814 RepID=A0A240DXH8_9BURK|nr:Protein of unknown function [Polynucleobacter meluiroseus]